MSVDLNAILQPIVDTVRDLYFPSTVSIQSRTDAQDAGGQLTPTYGDLETGVLALIEPILAQTGTERIGPVITDEDYVRILMADEHTVPQDGVIAVTAGQGAGEVWDVVGVHHDPVRVTTQVIGRRQTPGSPS